MVMSTSTSFISRIGRVFKRSTDGVADGPDGAIVRQVNPDGSTSDTPSRLSFLRPWARRDARLESMQQGFANLTTVLTSVRDNLETQNRKQEELLSQLSRLPELLAVLPDSARVQEETLRAIHETMENQNGQTKKLGEVIDRIHQSDGKQREHLDAIRERVETLHQHDETIAANLSGVSGALQSVSSTSHESAKVLEGLRESLDGRDARVEQLLTKQSTRFFALMVASIVLSVSALIAMGVMAYLLLAGHIR